MIIPMHSVEAAVHAIILRSVLCVMLRSLRV